MGFLTSNVKDRTNDTSFQDIPLVCPRCHIYMKKIHKNGVIIDYCTKCGGMWLDQNEIENLLKL